MKKALITGAAGFLGFHLTNYLLKKGYKVDLIDNFNRGRKDQHFLKNLKNKNTNFFRIDLLNSNKLLKLEKNYKLIFHFAAIVGVKNVINKPYEVLNTNVKTLANVINFASLQKKLSRFCFTSSSEVYSVSMRNKIIKPPVDEDIILSIKDLKNPRDTYLLSKIFGESMCNHSGLPFTILRPHNIYGPRMGLSHVIPELIMKAMNLKQGQLKVYSPNHTRTFCYIDDAIEMIFKLVTNKKSVNGTYNIGNEKEEIKIKNLAKLILNLLNKKNKIKHLTNTIGSPKRRKPNVSKIKKLLKLKKNTSLKAGVLKTYLWYKNSKPV